MVEMKMGEPEMDGCLSKVIREAGIQLRSEGSPDMLGGLKPLVGRDWPHENSPG